MEEQTLQYLQAYLAQGWPLFPVSSKNKRTFAGSKGFKDATLEWQQIEAWAQQYPGCAWAVATSAERAVLDIDPRHGGDKSLAKLEADNGPLPPTPRGRTGGAGWHYWFRFPPGTPCGVVAPGIDRKAEGGYVVVPPSRIGIPEHEGRAYAWEVPPWGMPLANAPAWLLGVKPEPKADAEEDPWVVREAGGDLLTHPGSPEGERRKTLCQLIGVHLARGDSEASIEAMAEAWAGRCTPPFGDWRKHVAGLMRKEGAERLTTLSLSPATNGIPPEPGREQTNSGAAGGYRVTITEEPAPELVPSLHPVAESIDSKPELFPSLPGPGGEQQGETGGVSTNWPTLSADAYHGLLGEMLRAVEPQTEADPAGVLLGWLACFGSCVGRGAWVTLGPDVHHPASYLGIVGPTSARKGMGYAVARWPFAKADPAWAELAVCNGVGSGQGLIERVRDESRTLKLNKRTGEVEENVIPGARDKRCLLRLDELAVCFKLQRSDNSTLGETLMTAWSGVGLEVPNRSGNDLRATDYSIAVIGDTQPGTLAKLLASGKGIEEYNGWLNRFLWAVVRRQRSLSRGGKMSVLEPFLGRLADALAFAKHAGEVTMDAQAEAAYEVVYDDLVLSGDSIPHTERAAPYAVRLAMVYALADRSAVIRVEHLRAALAVVSYCQASARLLFGEVNGVKPPDPLWLQLLNAISNQPGISRTGLREVVGHKVKAEDIDAALVSLKAQGLAYSKKVQPAGGGKPAECWWPGPEPTPAGDGEGMTVDNPSAPPPGEDADAQSRWREGTNSPPAGASLFPPAVANGEGTNSPLEGVSLFPPPSGGGELVCSLPVPDGEKGIAEGEPPTGGVVNADAPAGGQGGEERVVNREADAYLPRGGFGLATSPPAKPDRLEPQTVLQRRHLAGEWQEHSNFDADRPPDGRPFPPRPERLPGESDYDYFVRRLEAADAELQVEESAIADEPEYR